MVKKFSANYSYYVLSLLTIVAAFAYIDRQLIIILQESIKEELGLTDTQLGFASGLAFTIMYVTLSIPVAYLADRFNRKNIIALALAVWSGITALTGLASNFIQLVMARMGVGVGETGSNPPAYAIIADYFPKEKRARAFGIYNSGIYVGILLGFLIGGYMVDSYGWRAAFYVVGIPGVLFSLLIYFTLKEPIRGQAEKVQIEQKAPPKIKEVFQMLFRKKSFVYLALGAGLHTLVGTAFGNWMAPFLARIHGVETVNIGIWLATVAGVGGIAGTYLGGYLADKFGQRDVRWYLWLPSIAIVINFPFTMGVLFFKKIEFLFIAHLLGTLVYTTYLSPCYAILQDLVDIRMRATASAILAMIFNIFGMGTGPLLGGLLSDFFEPTFGIYALRWSLFYIAFLKLLGAFLLWKGAKTLKADLVVH